MSKESPIFPIPDPFLYCPKSSTIETQSHGKAHHLKLHRPISSKDELKSRNRKRRSWWKTTTSAALLFRDRSEKPPVSPSYNARHPYPAVSQPLYLTDGGESAPQRPSSRHGSGGIPYVSLRHFVPAAAAAVAPPPAPIYLVT